MANDLVLGATLSQAVYSSYNQSNTPEVDGWKPVHLNSDYFRPERADPAFDAQLYQKGDQFMVVFGEIGVGSRFHSATRTTTSTPRLPLSRKPWWAIRERRRAPGAGSFPNGWKLVNRRTHE